MDALAFDVPGPGTAPSTPGPFLAYLLQLPSPDKADPSCADVTL